MAHTIWRTKNPKNVQFLNFVYDMVNKEVFVIAEFGFQVKIVKSKWRVRMAEFKRADEILKNLQ